MASESPWTPTVCIVLYSTNFLKLNCLLHRNVLERVAQYYCFINRLNVPYKDASHFQHFVKTRCIVTHVRTKYSSCITMACVVCVFLVSNEATYISFTVWPKPCSLCCNGFCSMNYHSVMLLKKSVVNCIEKETQPKVHTYRSIHRYMCVCVWCVSVCGVWCVSVWGVGG